MSYKIQQYSLSITTAKKQHLFIMVHEWKNFCYVIRMLNESVLNNNKKYIFVGVGVLVIFTCIHVKYEYVCLLQQNQQKLKAMHKHVGLYLLRFVKRKML